MSIVFNIYYYANGSEVKNEQGTKDGDCDGSNCGSSDSSSDSSRASPQNSTGFQSFDFSCGGKRPPFYFNDGASPSPH